MVSTRRIHTVAVIVITTFRFWTSAAPPIPPPRRFADIPDDAPDTRVFKRVYEYVCCVGTETTMPYGDVLMGKPGGGSGDKVVVSRTTRF